MNKEQIKKVVSDTEKELKQKETDKQIEKIKEIVTKSLKRLDELQKQDAKLKKLIKYIKMDLDDLKQGKLDSIVERQEKDEEAKKSSVVIIIKEKEIIREKEFVPYAPPLSPWYQPYRFIWNTYPIENNFCYTGIGDSVTIDNSNFDVTNDFNLCDNSSSFNNAGYSINCSVAKNASSGAYEIGDKIVHLR